MLVGICGLREVENIPILTYTQARQALAQGKYPLFLILHGEAHYLSRKLIRELRNLMEKSDEIEYLEWDEEAGDTDIFTSLTTIPLWLTRRLVVINNTQTAELKNYLKVNNPRLVCVLLCDHKLKKKDIPEAENCWVVECSPPKGRDLIKWLSQEAAAKGKELPASSIEYLRFTCGDDPAVLAAEIEKAAVYLGSEKKITIDILKKIGSRTAGRTLFEFVDAVAEHKGSLALEIAGELLAQGNHPVLLVSMLSRHYLQMLEAAYLLQEGVAAQDLSSQMGVHPYVGKKLIKQLRSSSIKEIERVLFSLLELDLSIKQGKGSPELLLVAFLGEVC